MFSQNQLPCCPLKFSWRSLSKGPGRRSSFCPVPYLTRDWATVQWGHHALCRFLLLLDFYGTKLRQRHGWWCCTGYGALVHNAVPCLL